MALPPVHAPLPVTATPDANSLPIELGNALLSLATCAVPIGLVSRLSRNLSTALHGRTLDDTQVLRLAAALTRAAGPWLPTRHRFRALGVRIRGLLLEAGSSPMAADAVIADLREAFRVRLGH